jgi:hypothetical protein
VARSHDAIGIAEIKLGCTEPDNGSGEGGEPVEVSQQYVPTMIIERRTGVVAAETSGGREHENVGVGCGITAEDAIDFG